MPRRESDYKNMTNMCLECAKTRDRKHKETMGLWIDQCDFCGKDRVACASAEHDFGVYKTNEDELRDRVQDGI